MLDALKLESSFSKLAARAKQDGAEAELLVESGESLRLSVNSGKVEKFDSSNSQVGGLRVILNGVEGYCWTESLEDNDLDAAYTEAVENAKFASRGRSADQIKNEAVALYSSNDSVKEDLSLFNDSLEGVPIDQKIERAIEIEKRTKAVDARISSVPYNSYGEASGEFFVFNTRGVRAHQRRTSISGYAYCLAKQVEESRMAGDSFFTRDASKVATTVIDEVARRAGEKALRKLGASSPETGRYPVVIDREVVAQVFGLIVSYFSAKSIAERTSIFGSYDKATGKSETELGKIIASPLLTVTDDPSVIDGVGNRAFDAEGARAKKTDLIRAGVLSGFLTNSVYARKLGLPHTASASRSAKDELDIGTSNLIIALGGDSFEALLSSYPKVIYVTDFTGYHAGFNAGSGEFGFQSEGELWENGKRVKALCNFVVAGSIRELLMGVEKVSSRVTKKTSSVLAPDLLISSLSVAGA
jgi:PmbA protein